MTQYWYSETMKFTPDMWKRLRPGNQAFFPGILYPRGPYPRGLYTTTTTSANEPGVYNSSTKGANPLVLHW